MTGKQRPSYGDDDFARRELHFFWLADYSASMGGNRIATLNQAIREVIPDVRKIAADNPEVDMYMRAIKFSSSADWHVGPDAVPVENFVWSDLSILGGTSTSSAINLLCDQLEPENMPQRGVPPICVLVSDGFCTDGSEVYQRAIDRLNDLSWGRKAIRLAIAIGDDAEYSEDELLQFVNHPEVGLLKARTADQLVKHIRWVSTEPTKMVSDGTSGESGGNELKIWQDDGQEDDDQIVPF